MKKISTKEIDNNIFYQISIFQKLFYCCSGYKDNFPEVKNEYGNSSLNGSNNSSIFPMIKKYIRQDEKYKIKFSKKGIIEFINYLQNLEYSKKYKSEIYKISIRDSSILSQDSLLIRFEAKINKNVFNSEIPNITVIFDAIKNPYKNLKWNIFNKEYIILQNISENADIAKKILVKQMNIIPEKEFYNKRIYFLNEGIIYFFTSSIPDSFFPPKDDNLRGLNYFEIIIIKEDNNYFLFDIFQQRDIKMSIPQTVLMINLPEKLREYFEKLINFLNNNNNFFHHL